MTDSDSVTGIRHDLPALVHELSSGRAVELTLRGKPVAVLVSHEHYGRLVSNQRSFGESYRRFTQEFDLSELAIDPDEVFAGVRE